MSPIYLYNNAILVVNNALAASLSCCCGECVVGEPCDHYIEIGATALEYCSDLNSACSACGGTFYPDDGFGNCFCIIDHGTFVVESCIGYDNPNFIAPELGFYSGICCNNVCHPSSYCIVDGEIQSGPDWIIPFCSGEPAFAVCCSGEPVPDYPGFNPCECPPYTVWVPGTGPEDPGNCVDPGWNCIDGNCVAWDGNGDIEFPGYNDCITYCV